MSDTRTELFGFKVYVTERVPEGAGPPDTVKAVATMPWDWEGSDELCEDFAERLVAYVLDHERDGRKDVGK